MAASIRAAATRRAGGRRSGGRLQTLASAAVGRCPDGGQGGLEAGQELIETFHVDRAGANHSTRRWQRASQSAVGGLPAWFAGEARHWASWTSGVNPAGCWRAREGAKVDLISEDDDGRGVGLEIKSLAVTRPKDLAGLRALRDAFGSRFAGGVLLSTGRLAYQAGRSIAVLPIRSLWSRS